MRTHSGNRDEYHVSLDVPKIRGFIVLDFYVGFQRRAEMACVHGGLEMLNVFYVNEWSITMRPAVISETITV
jgi:hypothetical protein